MDKKFEELENGDSFIVYGDEYLNYDYPKICTCKKDNRGTAHEINGISFCMSGGDIVDHIPTTNKRIA